jgi:DNA-3-methyladenine glycosylase I
MLILEGFQAGLSWRTILKKRKAFATAFLNWNAARIARFTDADAARLMGNAAIVRNRLKIRAAINNARCFLEVRKEFGSFDAFIWQFTGNKTLLPPKPYASMRDVPARTAESDAMSRELKKRGFSFAGSVVCYSFMQAVGMVNDHIHGCFKGISQ